MTLHSPRLATVLCAVGVSRARNEMKGDFLNPVAHPTEILCEESVGREISRPHTVRLSMRYSLTSQPSDLRNSGGWGNLSFQEAITGPKGHAIQLNGTHQTFSPTRL